MPPDAEQTPPPPLPAPAWIETVDDEAARSSDDPILAEVYGRIGGRKMNHIMRSNNLNPPVLRAHFDLFRVTAFGPSPLTRAQREMIATVVSIINQCHY